MAGRSGTTKKRARPRAAATPRAKKRAPPPEASAGAGPAGSEQLWVVGIGASAGGLEAVAELVRHARSDHTAWILVMHLAPDHESQLASLLSKNARLEVQTATDGLEVEANHLYVIPPNADLAVLHGVIQLVPPASPHGPRLPVDFLFRSLADDFGSRCAGVVLSGTGTDGTFGLKAIKAAGGITFVQDPASARYDGMPRSALASGAADFCLEPKAIAEELGRLAAHPLLRRRPPVAPPAPEGHDQLGKLFVLIRSEFGTDLTHYKPSTLERRIERRMLLHRLSRLPDYVRFVQENRDELHALFKDMLISVTSFFRDPEVFEALAEKVLPRLLEQLEPNAPLRIWVPACASGEEAYSIAICVLELLEAQARDTKVQIFGTDIDEESVQHARRGVYPANIALDVSRDRLSRFFVKRDGEYLISRRVRDLIVFSRQNVLKDAPFSRMDLVSCRNLLIYLQPPAQKKVLRILHYALKPAGCLLLGSSETVGDAPDLFSALDRKSKLYQKKLVPSQAGLDVSFGTPASPLARASAPAARPPLSLQALSDRKVLELYAPPSVVVNENLEVLQFRGRTGPFLDPAPGMASFNLLKIARFELHIELKRALEEAIATQRRVTAEVAYPEDGRQTVVTIDVVPLEDPETKARCLLVLFQRQAPRPEGPVAAEEGRAGARVPLKLSRRLESLERELAVTKEFLQSTLEEKESTLEELKSANEELQSSNEELQSTNEELETSKEEMQSSNEELTTVNEELQNRMAELSLTNDDLHNVLAGVDSAVVIVGMDHRIRRFTAAAERLFNLVPADIGRSISFLDPFLGVELLESKVAAVIESLTPFEQEVQASNHRWYALKVSPYKTLDHAIRGALITVVDIDVRKRSAEMTRDAAAYAARFLTAIGHPLAILDARLRVVWVNEPFLSTFQLAAEEVLKHPLPGAGSRQWSDPELLARLGQVAQKGVPFRNFPLRLRTEAGERAFQLSGSQLPTAADSTLVLLSVEPEAPKGVGR